MAEGTGLKEVLMTPGVEWKKSYSNSVLEMNDVFGIEAARWSIINEIQLILKNQDISIDPRHLSILADRMCAKGQILGLVWHGIKKMKNSVLLNASFEQTQEHLFTAAI